MKVSYDIKTKVRKKKASYAWSRQRRSLLPQEYLRLPTRATLTYAEAQKFVDVETNGEVHRLNVCEPLELVMEETFPEGEESVTTDISFQHVELQSSAYADDSCSMFPTATVPQPCVKVVESTESKKSVYARQASYFRYVEKTTEALNAEIEYEMDEQDIVWLKLINEIRQKEKLVQLSHDSFEAIFDQFEKEAYSLTVSGTSQFSQSCAVCEICTDGEFQSTNRIIECDMCNLAVHQDCYGVPYMPEGDWLCKKCLKSPNESVDCCLCPVKNGALKQTDDGRWVHVLCAFWIPEVTFRKVSCLEPIEKIDRVPETLLRLKCEICKTQGTGACIRCQAPSCTSSFHATCAVTVGLFMKMEATSQKGSRTNYRKIVFCNRHRPVEASLYRSDLQTESSNDCDSFPSPVPGAKGTNRLKSRKSKKSFCENLPNEPCIVIPTIPSKQLAAIADHLNVRDRHQLVGQLHAYWLLKRQSRNGYPLIRRLHIMLAVHRSVQLQLPEIDEDALKVLKTFRQDLDKVRLLLRLIQSREKLKCEDAKLKELIVHLQLQPFSVLLDRTLDQLQTKDPSRVFSFPVSISEVPDYLDYVSHPMDFSVMRTKIEDHRYDTISEFDADFQLIINNCLTYNEKGSVLHKMALKLKEQGDVIIAAARRMSERADYCVETGLHRPHNVDCVVTNADPTLNSSRSSQDSSFEGILQMRLKELLKCLDAVQVVRSARNCVLAKRLRRKIATCRRKLTLFQQDGKSTDEIKDDCFHKKDGQQAQGNVTVAGACLEEGTAITKTASGLSKSESPTLNVGVQSSGVSFHADRNHHSKMTNQSPGHRFSVNGTVFEQTSKRQLDNSWDSSDHQLYQRKCGRFHMIAQPVFVADSKEENDSSYESSCSVISESDWKKCYGADDVNGRLRNVGFERKSSRSVQDVDAETALRPKDIVWAKSKGYPWYPAMIIDPEFRLQKDDGLKIVPPSEVLKLRPKCQEPVYLVRFFDKRHNWQWLPRNKIKPLGIDNAFDSTKIMEIKQCKLRGDVKRAFEEALGYVTSNRTDITTLS